MIFAPITGARGRCQVNGARRQTMKRRELKFVAGSLGLAPDRIEVARQMRRSAGSPRNRRGRTPPRPRRQVTSRSDETSNASCSRSRPGSCGRHLSQSASASEYSLGRGALESSDVHVSVYGDRTIQGRRSRTSVPTLQRSRTARTCGAHLRVQLGRYQFRMLLSAHGDG